MPFMLPPVRTRLLSALAAVCLLLPATGAPAQLQQFEGIFKLDDAGPARKAPEATVDVRLTAQDGVATLAIKVALSEGANTYSLNPKFGGRTKIDVQTTGLEPIDAAFTPDHPPKLVQEPTLGELEKYFGEVTWSRKYKVAPDAEAKAAGSVSYQVCDSSNCIPLTHKFDVRLASAGTVAAEEVAAPSRFEDVSAPGEPSVPEFDLSKILAASSGPADLQRSYQVVPTRPLAGVATPEPLTLQFELISVPEHAAVVLSITMRLDDGFTTYDLTKAPGQIQNPTAIDVTELSGLEPLGSAFVSVRPPEMHKEVIGDKTYTSRAFEKEVTWTRAFRVEEGKAPGAHGSIRYQICDTSCRPPLAVKFSLGSLQNSSDVAAAKPVANSVAADAKTAALVAAELISASASRDETLAQVSVEDESQNQSLGFYLLCAFLGGLILNVMPCVLPVISIKVLSFVHQAGSKPGRIFLLNAAYSLGVMAVFVVLATLAVSLKLGWGAQNQSAAFNVSMVCIVFAMGLSLLGVFEIPIPGMVTSSVGGHHQPEGLFGAFLTGAFATTLATPCTGPFMGTALVWSVKQPVQITYLVWCVMGLGMALPYLLLGCFPKLVDLVPRPGNWMVTFKQFCGFLLMGTAVWLMNTIQGLNHLLVVPTLIILVGLSLALWMVGNLYDLSSTRRRRWSIRALALLLGGPVIALGISWSREAVSPAPMAAHQLPWQPFSTSRLAEALEQGKPILIDFTADWCLICKTNEAVALNTRDTAEFIARHDVIPLLADYTKESPDIKEWLDKFKSISVPLTVIIPADRSKSSIALRSYYSQGDLLKKLEQAVERSKPVNEVTASNRAQPVSIN